MLVNDFTSTDPARDIAQGFVGVQNHGAGETVYYRNIRVKEERESDVTAPTTTASLSPAAPASGWYAAAPTLTLAAADEADGSGVARTEWRLKGSAAWTAYAGPVAVPGGDGAHVVEFRSVDVAGNVEETRSLSVSVDATAPAVTVTGIADGAAYGTSTSATVVWGAADATSGLASTTALLDGKPLSSGTKLTMYDLTLGQHELVVTATDKAGNLTRRSVKFRVTTSLADLDALIDVFTAEGTISSRVADTLRSPLDEAINQAELGKRSRVVSYLQTFVTRVNNRVEGSPRALYVRQVLRRDAQALIEQYKAPLA